MPDLDSYRLGYFVADDVLISDPDDLKKNVFAHLSAIYHSVSCSAGELKMHHLSVGFHSVSCLFQVGLLSEPDYRYLYDLFYSLMEVS